MRISMATCEYNYNILETWQRNKYSEESRTLRYHEGHGCHVGLNLSDFPDTLNQMFSKYKISQNSVSQASKVEMHLCSRL